MTNKQKIKLRFVNFYSIINITKVTYKDKEYKAIAFTGNSLLANITANTIQEPNMNVIGAFIIVNGGKNFGIKPQKEIYFDGKTAY